MADDPPGRAPGENLWVDYHIHFDDGSEITYRIDLDPETLGLRGEAPSPPPAWAALTFHQCEACPLDPATHPWCPIAVRTAPVVDTFKDEESVRVARVEVHVAERTYSTTCNVQTMLSSLMGVYMTTSGCPVLDRLRPMVETHLPFAGERDTAYRMITMYLFAQYCRSRSGRRADWTLRGLTRFFRDVDRVNQGFCQRLQAVPHVGDAHINAVTKLNCLAWLTRLTLEDGRLAHWEDLFVRHWG